MELVIILVIAAIGIWYFFFRDKKTLEDATGPVAPYKVEPMAVAEVTKVELVGTPEITNQPVAESEAQKQKKAKSKPASKPKATKTAPKPKAKKPKMEVAK